MSGAFAEHAVRLLSNGYSPVPIRVLEKRPYLKNWGRLRKAAMTPDEIGWLSWRQPWLGLGVAGGYNCLVPVDVDAEDEAIVRAVRAALPAPTVTKVGRRGFTAFYRDESGAIDACKFRGVTGMLAEVSVTGLTNIPPTVHPDTRRPYRWLTDRTLFGTAVYDLPVLTPGHIEALRETLRPWLPEPRCLVRVATRAASSMVFGKREAAYARAVLAGEVRALTLMVPRSGRNCRLFQAGCKLGKWVHHGVLMQSEVEIALMSACEVNGLISDDGQAACFASLANGLKKAVGDSINPLPNRGRFGYFGEREGVR